MKLRQSFLQQKILLNKKLYNFKDINTTKALNEYHIIGVIKNFNFNSLRDVITPLALKFGTRQWKYFGSYSIMLISLV